jgi:methionyl-tRNA synthetase
MYIHGYLLLEGHKMSKSLGNTLDPDEVMDRFGADALRYYLMREVSFGQDGQVSPEGFETRYETELANDYGNLASRTLAMVDRYREGVVPAADADPDLAAAFDGVVDRLSVLFDSAEISKALDEIWELVRRLNRFVEETKPWELAKDEASADALDTSLYSLAEGLRVVTLLLHPFMPTTTARLLDQLAEPSRGLAEFGSRPGGVSVSSGDPLFPKLD